MTPKVGVREQFSMSPSMMDPNSDSFKSVANQLPSYLNANSPGANMNGSGYPSAVTQAADLSTPGMQLTALTPMGIPHTTAPNNTSAMTNGHMTMDVNMFNSTPQFHGLAQGHDYNGQLYAPPTFIHKNPDYDVLDGHVGEQQPALDGNLDGNLNGNLNGIALSNSSTSLVSDHASVSKFDNFYDESKEK